MMSAAAGCFACCWRTGFPRWTGPRASGPRWPSRGRPPSSRPIPLPPRPPGAATGRCSTGYSSESLLANFIFRPEPHRTTAHFRCRSGKKTVLWPANDGDAQALIIRLAAEVYKRERGRPPANAGELAGLIPQGSARRSRAGRPDSR